MPSGTTKWSKCVLYSIVTYSLNTTQSFSDLQDLVPRHQVWTGLGFTNWPIQQKYFSNIKENTTQTKITFTLMPKGIKIDKQVDNLLSLNVSWSWALIVKLFVSWQIAVPFSQLYLRDVNFLRPRKYSLTSPYGHLYNTDTSLLRTVPLVPEMPKIIHSLPL